MRGQHDELTETPSRTHAAPNAKSSAMALIVGAAVLIAISLAPIGVGLASAVVLYELCARPCAWVARRVPAVLAAVLTAAAVLALLVGPLVWLGHHLSARLPAVLAAMATSRQQQGGASANGMATWLNTQAAHTGEAAADWLPHILSSLGRDTAWTLMNSSIAFLGLYYLLTAAPTTWPRFADMLPLSPAGTESLRARFRDITLGSFVGTLLSASAQGVAIGIGFQLAGIRDASFWGAAAALATLVPIVGNALVWLPALVVTLVRQQYGGAIAIGIFGALLPPLIDRLARATVARHVGRVHPMVTLVGAIAGLGVAGAAGIILGPIVLAMFFAFVAICRREYLMRDVGIHD
jgi:predicted PurR-regulated permease PerM